GFSNYRPKVTKSKEFIEKHFRMPSNEYALVRGKEVIVRCKFKDTYGGAFTAQPKAFGGKLKNVLELLFGDSGDRAIYFATLNATLGHLEMVKGTVHCKGDEPKKCGVQLAEHILKNFGNVKIAHIGYQPGHVEACSKNFDSYVTDLNPENVGMMKFGKKIIDGSENEEVIKKVKVACITGSALTNATLPDLIR
ncbi:MAG: Rossmann-like domain-containing protein, partial [Candidatus Hadarchaeaceae archaeon]